MTTIFQHFKRSVQNPKYAFSKLSNVLDRHIKQDKYKKFIVLSRARTGSNMLISMLDSHPSISAKGELLVKRSGKRIDEMLKNIYCKQPRSIKAAGFKIFYYHPTDDKSGQVWHHLKNIKNLYVIHLKRKNILKTLLSRKIADKTNRWHKINSEHDPQNPNDKKTTFTEEELLDGFKETRDWENSCHILLPDRMTIEVCYEDLIATPEQEFRKITEFLELPYAVPTTVLQRQNPEKISDLIVNYSSLKNKFANTDWIEFFEE